MSPRVGVSVVVPVYNKERELPRCISSIAAQTAYPDEIIFVDDGCTDGSGEILQNATLPSMKVIRQANQGECAARNTGIKAATQELVAFIDADDEWMPTFLERIIEMAEVFPEAGAYGTAFVIDKGEQGRHFQVLRGGRGKGEPFVVGDFFRHPECLWSSSVAVRRSLFDRIGLFRVGIRRGGDRDMWFRVGCTSTIVYSPQVCAIWHWQASNRVSLLLAPHEEDFLSVSLSELVATSSILPARREAAELYIQAYNFNKALRVLFSDREKGTKALKQWRVNNGTTLRWLLHCAAISVSVEGYIALIEFGMRVKQSLRNVNNCLFRRGTL